MHSRLLTFLETRGPRFLQPYVARVQASPLGQRMAVGVFWSTVGTVASRLLALLTSVVMARTLGKTVFGELGIAQSTVSMFATFATVGMGLTATKYVAEFREGAPERAGRIIGMTSLIAWSSSLVIGAGIIVAAPWLAAHTLGAPHLANILRISVLLLLFSVVNEAQIGSLSGLEAFRIRSTAQTVASILGFPIAVVGVWCWGLPGAVWALGLAQGVLVLLNWIGLKREARKFRIPVNWRLSRDELRIILRFSLPTLLGGVVYVPPMWLANAIIVNVPGGYAEMGVFRAADSWKVAITFLPSLLGGVALPMLSNLRGPADGSSYQRVLWTNVRLSFLLAAIAAAPIALSAYWIMASYGTGFVEGRWILVGLCVQGVLSATSWILIQSIVSQGRMWLMLLLNLVWAILLVVPCWYWRTEGAMALLAGYLLADGSRFVVMFLLVRRSPTPSPQAIAPVGPSVS